MMRIPVAGPLLLNTACLNGTRVKSAATAIRFSLPNCVGVNFFRLENSKCRGNKLVVARGQTFRHTPTARTKSAGATGINIFQKSNKPNEGKNNKQVSINAPINQTPACAARQKALERGDKSMPDLNVE